jgi:hypothetical protein
LETPAAAAAAAAAAAGARPHRRVARVAFSPDLGVPPVEDEVAHICRSAAGWWQQQGAQLQEACPDLQDMQQVFLVGACGVHVLGGIWLLMKSTNQLTAAPYQENSCTTAAGRGVQPDGSCMDKVLDQLCVLGVYCCVLT